MDLKFITYIILIVIALITSVCACLSFSNKNEAFSFLLRGLSFVAIMALGLFSANFNDNISASVIYIMLGTAIYSLKIHDFKKFVKSEEPTPTSEPQKKSKKPNVLEITAGVSTFIALFCFFGASLFLTEINFMVFPLAIIFTIGLELPYIILNKKFSLYDFIITTLMFLSSSLMLGESILLLMDGFSLVNIFFAYTSLIFIVSIYLSSFEDKKGIRCTNLILQYVALIILNSIIYLL